MPDKLAKNVNQSGSIGIPPKKDAESILSAGKISIYREKCHGKKIKIPEYFMNKLRKLQELLKSNENNQSNVQGLYRDSQKKGKKYYRLSNIVWSGEMMNQIRSGRYPSEYFMDVVSHLDFYENQIINPPIQLAPNLISKFCYIPLEHNKLLIIDALMNQGSCPRYQNKDRFIYSEHSGVISIANRKVDRIIISADTNRTDIGDDSIYLPVNGPIMEEYEYLFHTHPNTMTYGGRVKDGVLYEFPSANDLFNFIKYYNEGKVQASLIVSPEGAYLIRPNYYVPEYEVRPNLFHYLRKFIIKLEKSAIKKYRSLIPQLANPDIFHQHIASDYAYINLYNKFIKPANLYIEYYPRKKKNGEWILRQINLPYVEIF